MAKRFFPPERAQCAADHSLTVPGYTFSSGDGFMAEGRATEIPGAEGTRVIRYVFSDTSVGRDMHTIAADAWDTRNFQRNPVFLWAHDSDQPPVGRVVDLRTVDGRLIGSVEYPERDVYPFADTVFQMVRGGYLNATSTGWLPLEWHAASDRKRPGGVDFTRVELLEISQVPVPALPTALVTARAAGIDTGPIFEWAEQVLDGGRSSILARSDIERLRIAAKMPSGRAEPQAKEPPAAAEAPPAPAPAKPALKRDLWTVGYLAQLLADLGFVQDMSEFEAEYEGDGSPVPAAFMAALKMLGQVLVDMAAEEVAELVAGDGDERKGIAALLRSIRAAPSYVCEGLARAAADAAQGRSVAIYTREGPPITLQREGKVLSSANEERVRTARGHCQEAMTRCQRAVDTLTELFADDANPEAGPSDDEARKARADRERRAAEAKARLAALN